MAVLPVNLRYEVIYGALPGPVSGICIESLGVDKPSGRRNSENSIRSCLVHSFVHNLHYLVYIALPPLVQSLPVAVFLEEGFIVPHLFSIL